MNVRGRFSSLSRFRREPEAVTPADETPLDEAMPLFDEELLARLRKLVLISRRSLATGIAGEHKSRRKGTSPEFSDFKSYSQGDDYRRIDWNIYSRLDELFIRLSEVTTELTVHILLDASNSMAFSSRPGVFSKFAYSRRLAGSLAYVSLWHFDRILITPFGEKLGTTFGPVQGRSHIQPTLRYLNALPSMGSTSLEESLRRYTSSRYRPGMLILISDLLAGDPAALQEAFRHARTRGWQLSVVHIIDEAELDPGQIVRQDGFERSLTLELVELESNERLRLTATDDVISRYRQSVAIWKRELEEICSAERIVYIELHTDWPFESFVLARLYEAGLVA